MRLFSLFIISLTLIACGSSSDNSDTFGTPSTDTPSADVADPVADPVAGGKTFTDNFGSEGNLWKPAGDAHASGAGNLVIVIAGKYSTQFDSCSVKKADGTTAELTCVNNVPWTHHPFSCFANPIGGLDRQHWRANFECGSAASVEAICHLGLDTYVFQAPDGRFGEVCTRFG